MHSTGNGQFDPDVFFAPTRPWFSVDAVRAEALGRATMVALTRFRGKTRAAVFPVQPVLNDGDREDVPVQELYVSEDPPSLHPLPLALPEGGRKERPKPRPPPGGLGSEHDSLYDAEEE
ncbi:hypothetical protein ONZ43_g5404 [Nemania bipapillata]|uniref:Uncharacterized protein n=1 Tax=Nemania bipapillata TaxID=110536 RepID=A0ACC2IB82_9PEZI|nr:hypothetical protein ONZ43_g5404 [Nemania bipapillata]